MHRDYIRLKEIKSEVRNKMLKKPPKTPRKPPYLKVCGNNYVGIKSHCQYRKNHALATYRTEFMVRYAHGNCSALPGIEIVTKWLSLPEYLIGKKVRLKLEVISNE
jgi:hypothetical protein